MFERFTKDARAVVVGAQDQARRLGSRQIDVAHLLLALADRHGAEADALAVGGVDHDLLAAAAGDALDASALASIGVDLDAVRRRADEVFGPGAFDRRPGRSPRRHIPFTRDAKKVLESSLREAITLGDREIAALHLLLGATRPATAGADLVRRCGGDPQAVRRAALARRDAA